MNQTLFNFFYGFAHQNSALDILINFAAEWYPYIILITLFVYLFKHRDNPKKGVGDLFAVGATAVFAYVTAYILKDVVHTLRPFDALTWVKPLVSESGSAFPSGHATFFMALAAALWFYHKRLSIFFGVSAIIIGIARIMAGIHWPVDIAGGLVIGFAIGVTLHRIFADIFDSVWDSYISEAKK